MNKAVAFYVYFMFMVPCIILYSMNNQQMQLYAVNFMFMVPCIIRGLLEKYPTFGREKETGLLGALDT